jgi:hypothetical protein
MMYEYVDTAWSEVLRMKHDFFSLLREKQTSIPVTYANNQDAVLEYKKTT